TTSSPRRLRMLASQPPPMPAGVIVRPTRAAAAATSCMIGASSGTAIGSYWRVTVISAAAPGWRAAASTRQARTCSVSAASRAGAAEHGSAPGADPPEVEVSGAEEPDFLAYGEHGVERRMAEPALAAGAHALADDSHPRLVVAGEHRRAVAADHVALDDRLDA